MGNQRLYDKVVQITHVYLGPAADRFIARQVENHLHKRPTELSPTDLGQLIDWIQVAVSLLSDDTEIIEEYTEELTKLAYLQSADKAKPKEKRASA